MNLNNKMQLSESCKMAFCEYGDPQGVPVIALHGWLDNAASFYALEPYLEGIRLISLDFIGHGFSSRRPAGMPYHIWDNVNDLYQAFDLLGLEQVNLVGHSMGASIAMLFSGTFPERVDNLICIEGLAPLAYKVDELPELFSDAVVKRRKMISKSLKPYPTREDAIVARVNGRWPVSYEAAAKLLERGVVKTPDGYIWSHDPALMMPSLIRFAPEQICSFLRRVKANTVVIKGEDGLADLIDGWVDELKDGTLKVMLGGHHLHMDPLVAQEIAKLINRWAIPDEKER